MKKFLAMAALVGFTTLFIACNDKKNEKSQSQVPTSQDATKASRATTDNKSVQDGNQQEKKPVDEATGSTNDSNGTTMSNDKQQGDSNSSK